MEDLIKKGIWNDGYNTRYGELYPLLVECRDTIELCIKKGALHAIAHGLLKELNEVLE